MDLHNQTILFQGDSITDAGRNRDLQLPNHSVSSGSGYAGRIMGDLLAAYPDAGLRFYNRGISGNRIVDLLARWRPDAIQLKPDVISILIGVNDTWHHYQHDRGTSLTIFETVYRLIITETIRELPQTRFILCEPFAFAEGDFQASWLDDIHARAAVVRKLAEEFGFTLVPFQQRFNELLNEAPVSFWLPDGVHPSPAGHCQMAALWRQSAGF